MQTGFIQETLVIQGETPEKGRVKEKKNTHEDTVTDSKVMQHKHD